MDEKVPTKWIPFGTLLYKGFSNRLTEHNGLLPTEKPIWFAIDRASAEPYAQHYNGGIATYEVTADYELVRLDDVASIRALAPLHPTLQQVLEKAFPIESQRIRRQSFRWADDVLAKLLCELGFQGYYAGEIDGFSEELMLCDTAHVKLLEYEPKNPDWDPQLAQILFA